MGKPSNTRLSQSSNHTLHNLHATMSTLKKEKSIAKLRKKQTKSIQKLFDKLRNDSCHSITEDTNLSNSVIVLDDSSSGSPLKKRKSTVDDNNKAKLQKTESNIIVIKDQDVVTNTKSCPLGIATPKRKNSPIYCSTPLAKKDTVVELNISKLSDNNLNLTQNLNKEIQDLTKEINIDSFVTIDLTAETDKSKSFNAEQSTVIDLVNTSDVQDCTVISASNTSLSMSGDSDVTVLENHQNTRKNYMKMRKFAHGIAKLNATEKGRLLELITQNIFNGCNVPNNIKHTSVEPKVIADCATETAEDTFIKEVILGQVASRNSIGSNIYNPEKEIKSKSGLRMIVIDGSNVAMEHGQHKEFSVKGLKICIDYFVRRGHIVKAFVPRFRCKFGKSTEPRLLDELERKGLVVYTPSREVQGKFICSYDDRYIVQCAAEFDGVIVSGDNYRDLLQENPRWRFVITNRLLPFTWVNDMIMFPKDPLGRYGPSLEKFLRHD